MTQGSLFDDEESTGALFDDQRKYRYLLWRRWSKGPALLWIMLNPSTADETELDPTLRRCLDFTLRWGYPAMEIGNLYAYRSTEPKVLPTIPDPVGAENHAHLEKAIARAAKVVVGWGTNAKKDAIAPVLEIFERLDVQPYALKISVEGYPCHPLYLPKRLALIPWNPKAEAWKDAPWNPT